MQRDIQNTFVKEHQANMKSPIVNVIPANIAVYKRASGPRVG